MRIGSSGMGWHCTERIPLICRVDIDSLDDARKHASRLKSAGAISVKGYIKSRRDQRQQIIQDAQEASMMVVAEGEGNFQHNMAMIVAIG